MELPNIPENETERIHELESFNILDTIEEEDYDFLTRMASEICKTKISLISLIDNDRQWFKSHHGLAVRETIKNYAFCAHAINQPNEVLLVPDARKDARFHDNPLVIGDPNILFYIGVPLITDAGFAIGTLCAIDDKPKKLTNHQIDSLKALSKQVINLLELRKKRIELDSKKTQIENYFDKNLDLSVILRNDGFIFKVNKHWLDLFGYSMAEVMDKDIMDFIHPDDIDSSINALSQLNNQKDVSNFRNRFKTKSGGFKITEWSAYPDGKFIYATGRDITELIEERKFFHLMASRNEAILAALNKNTIVTISDLNGDIVYSNDIFCQISGYARDEIMGKNHNIVNSGYHPKSFWQDMWKTISQGNYWREEVCNITKYGIHYWVDTVIHPILNEQGAIHQYIAIRYLITEKKAVERKLIKTQGLLQQASEMSRFGAWEVDMINNTSDWSSVTKEIHEVPEDFVPDIKNGINFYKEGENRDKIAKSVNRAIEKGESYDIELQFVTAKGNELWVRTMGNAEFHNNICTRLYGTLQDITSKKTIEEKLIVSEMAFRGNFEYAGIGMAIVGLKGEWLKVNQMLCDNLGYTEKELLNLTFHDITHPDDLDSDLDLLNELIAGQRTHYQMEKRYFHKKGMTIYVILSVSAVRDVNGNILHFISQIIDITNSKEAELRLSHSLSKNQAMLDASTQVAIIETDASGIIQTFNKGAENMLGYFANEIVFKQTPQIIHLASEIEARSKELSDELGEEINGFDTFIVKANIKGCEVREWTYVHKNGEHIPVLLTVTPIYSSTETTGYLGVAADIRPMKKAEEELKLVLNLTKNQNQRLNNFAHIVSHNLRSHSGNLSSLLTFLFDENPELKELRVPQLIKIASENLTETIDHLSEVALLNTNEKKGLSIIDLSIVTKKAIDNVSALSKKAQVNIINEVPDDLFVLGIPAYMDSIVLNFLTNGIKYKADERSSFIKLFTSIDQDFLVLRIEDNGQGIDLEKYGHKLFGMYNTFHKNDDARGVGLFITKNQVESMGGLIEVASKVNIGTTFSIYFKYKVAN